jgi:hypothetical protein
LTFDASKVKLSTKGVVAFLLGVGSLLEVPAVSTPVFAAAKSHPHFAVALGVLTGLVALLHNPKVEQLLGVQTDTVTTTVGAASRTVTTQVPVAVNAIPAVPSTPASELLPQGPANKETV